MDEDVVCPKCGGEMALFETGHSHVPKQGWPGRGVYRCSRPGCDGERRDLDTGDRATSGDEVGL